LAFRFWRGLWDKFLSNDLGDQRGVPADPVVDQEVDQQPVFNGPVDDVHRLQNHFWVHHSVDQPVKRVSPFIGLVIPHPQRCQKPDHTRVPGVEKPSTGFRNLFPQGREPGPVGEDLSDPVFGQSFEDLVPEVEVGPEFEVVPRVFRDLTEELVQGPGQRLHRNPVFLPVVLLFENEAGEVRAQETHGGFEELLGEECGVEVGWVSEVLVAVAAPPGGNHLRDLENDPVPVFQVAGIGLQNLVSLSRFAALVQERLVKGEVELQDRKVLEILPDAVNREDLLDKRPAGDDLRPSGDPPLIATWGIDLPEPAGVPVARGPQEDLGVEVPEVESADVGLHAGITDLYRSETAAVGNRDHPEESLGVATVAPVVDGRPALSQLRIDYPVPVQNYHVRFADPPVLIRVPEDVEAHAAIVRQNEEVVYRHQFSQIKLELPRIERDVRELHPERSQHVGPGDRVLGVEPTFPLEPQEVFWSLAGQRPQGGRDARQPRLGERLNEPVPVEMFLPVRPQAPSNTRH
jgi:hypothetical protein